jgi:hypothetical protein
MASINLNLTQKQADLLIEDYDAKLNDIYYVDNDAIKSNVPIGAFLVEPGAYVLFVDGTETQHKSFLVTMFGNKPTPLAFMARGMWMYESPASRHAKPENKITIDIAP